MSALRIVAIPRDANPYQELLYAPMRERGARVRYASGLTPSRTLNLLLLPLELLLGRCAGYGVLHLHWVFGFRFTGPSRSEALGRASRLWFTATLRVARALGMRIVWTAHNVLPHEPVFDDDVAARRSLVDACDVVIAHAPNALDELEAIGARPRRSRIIPHGPIVPEELRTLAPVEPSAVRTILFFGRIAEYKGVEDLLEAVASLDGGVNVVIAGGCSDRALADRLITRAAELGGRVRLALGRVPDAELRALLRSADALVFPFRAVTTSGSLTLGLASGRLAVVPDLPAFSELPDEAVVRYPSDQSGGLAAALAEVAAMPAERIHDKGRAAREAALSVGWEEIAARTDDAMRDVSPHGSWLAEFRANHLLAGSATLLINTLVISVLGLVFWAAATHLYASASVGVYSGINSGASLLGAVVSIGWPLTIVRFLPSEPHQRRLVAMMLASVLLLGTAIVAIVEAATGSFLFPLLHIPRTTTDAALTLILVVVAGIGAVTDAALISQRATMTVLVKNTIGGLAKIVVLFPLAALGTTGLIVAATVGAVLAAALGSGALWRLLPPSSGEPRDLARAARYVRYSATGYASVLLGILPSTVVPLIVLAVTGPTSAGWFAMAFLIGGLLSFVPQTAAQVLFAEASRAPEHLRVQVTTAVKAIYALLAPACLLMIVCAPLIMSVLGQQYETHATGALRAMAAGSLFLGATYVIDSILTAVDRMRAYFAINAINSLLVLTLAALAADHGLTNVAIGWAVAQGLSAAIGLAILAAPRISGPARFAARFLTTRVTS